LFLLAGGLIAAQSQSCGDCFFCCPKPILWRLFPLLPKADLAATDSFRSVSAGAVLFLDGLPSTITPTAGLPTANLPISSTT
jgi:hypothetical protein